MVRDKKNQEIKREEEEEENEKLPATSHQKVPSTVNTTEATAAATTKTTTATTATKTQTTTTAVATTTKNARIRWRLELLEALWSLSALPVVKHFHEHHPCRGVHSSLRCYDASKLMDGAHRVDTHRMLDNRT
jgi:hypothetical protein